MAFAISMSAQKMRFGRSGPQALSLSIAPICGIISGAFAWSLRLREASRVALSPLNHPIPGSLAMV
jgi:hypothetical protein